MARPKTLGEPISLRLPTVSHQRLNTRASSKGQTVGEYARDVLLAHLGADPGSVTASAAAPTCAHEHRDILGGGLARCKSCGSMRNMRGVWS